MENENKNLIDKIKDEIILNGAKTTDEIAYKFLGVKNASLLNEKIVKQILKNYWEFYFNCGKWNVKDFSAKWENAEFSVEDFKKEPQTFGVFGFYDENKKIIFVGSAANLREKLLSLCENSSDTCENIKKLHKSAISYVVSTTDSEVSAQEIEQKLIAKHKPILNFVES
jgi:hypothetical protein